MMVHITIVLSLVIFIDYIIRNSYKKQGGFVGEEPSILPPKDDVLQHEQEVREKANDKEYFQIRGEDLIKTYPGASRMAVCKNTFGVKKHEIYGLLGPNGAGKSTTFSMMAM